MVFAAERCERLKYGVAFLFGRHALVQTGCIDTAVLSNTVPEGVLSHELAHLFGAFHPAAGRSDTVMVGGPGRSLRRPDHSGDPAHARSRLHAWRSRPGSGDAPRLERHLRRGTQAGRAEPARRRAVGRGRQIWAERPDRGGAGPPARGHGDGPDRRADPHDHGIPVPPTRSARRGGPRVATRPRPSISGRPKLGPSSASSCSGSGGRRKRSSSFGTSCASTGAPRARTSGSA